jgi:hypothetical protein
VIVTTRDAGGGLFGSGQNYFLEEWESCVYKLILYYRYLCYIIPATQETRNDTVIYLSSRINISLFWGVIFWGVIYIRLRPGLAARILGISNMGTGNTLDIMTGKKRNFQTDDIHPFIVLFSPTISSCTLGTITVCLYVPLYTSL